MTFWGLTVPMVLFVHGLLWYTDATKLAKTHQLQSVMHALGHQLWPPAFIAALPSVTGKPCAWWNDFMIGISGQLSILQICGVASVMVMLKILTIETIMEWRCVCSFAVQVIWVSTSGHTRPTDNITPISSSVWWDQTSVDRILSEKFYLNMQYILFLVLVRRGNISEAGHRWVWVCFVGKKSIARRFCRIYYFLLLLQGSVRGFTVPSLAESKFVSIWLPKWFLLEYYLCKGAASEESMNLVRIRKLLT